MLSWTASSTFARNVGRGDLKLAALARKRNDTELALLDCKRVHFLYPTQEGRGPLSRGPP
jgi:hypothetical protein